MGRAALLILLALSPLSAATGDAVPLRVLDVPPGVERDAFLRHIDFGRSLGFNAVRLWAPAEDDGTAEPDTTLGQRLDDCRRGDLRVLVELEPFSDPERPLPLLDDAPRRRLLERIDALRRHGVHDWIVSLHGAPLRLSELGELMQYGRIAAPAHVEFVAALARALPEGDRLWFRPPVDNDALLTNRRIQYVPALLRALPALPREVGIVWTGPERWSRSITGADVERVRIRFGGRPILLEDRYPESGRGEATALAVNLGPLRRRAPGIVDGLAGYIACPAAEVDASRLALRTVAAFLRDPRAYDPDRSAADAIAAAAGDGGRAALALKTQAQEWGGWIGEANYRTLPRESPFGVAASLQDPAATAAWVWVRRRYPERIDALAGLADTAFRDELIRVMRRRLAVARSVPLVRELRARQGAGRQDDAELLDRLRAERARWEPWPDAAAALDRFLVVSGVGLSPAPSRRRSPRPGTQRPSPGTGTAGSAW